MSDQFYFFYYKYPNLSDVRTQWITLDALASTEDQRAFFDVLHLYSYAVSAVLDRDGIIRYKSPSIQFRFGYQPQELIGLPASTNVHADDIDRLTQAYEEALQQPGHPVVCSFRYKHKSAGYLNVEGLLINQFDHPAIQGFIVHFQNNTEMHRMNNALVESREHLDLALKGARIGIWDWDIANKKLFYNLEWGAMLGYTAEEMKFDEEFWEHLIHPDDKAIAMNRLNQHLKGITETYEAEYRLRKKDGAYLWILDRGKVLSRDASGQAIRAAGIHQDIHAKRSAQESLQERTAALKRMNLELEQFAYITSHDVRAPMSNLVGLIHLLEQNEGNLDENVQLIRMMKSSILDLQKSLDNVDKILAGAGMTSEEPKVLQLKVLVYQVLRSFAQEVKAAGVTVNADFSKAPSIRYPYSHLHSYFVNLISNAIKFRSTKRKLQLTIRSYPTIDGLNIMVQDNGIGIDLEQFGDRIFQIHERFHAAEYGKGLGLFMIKKQLHYLGGDISVESEPDKGTTFLLRLTEQNHTFYAK